MLAACLLVVFLEIAWAVVDDVPAAPASPVPAASPADIPVRALDQSEYVGAKKCAECHQSHQEGWANTAHARMIRVPVVDGPHATVVADFKQPSEHRHFEIKDVKWVVGSRWKQRFIGEVDGMEVVFPAQWSVRDKKWMPYTGKSDWWYEQHKDWKTRSNFQLCAGCHSTGVNDQTKTWTELNISCESCHGPGKAHSAIPKPDNIVNPARLTTERSMDICLSCHQAGKPPNTTYAWPVGYQPGMELSKFWTGFKPEEGRQTAEFWHNGTAHKNRVQGNTFLQSVMLRHDIQCTNCHDMHSGTYTAMTIKPAASNALCYTCHGPKKDAGPADATLADHTHHGEFSKGSSCIECHMTKTGENAVTNEARNHTFDFISPASTIANGDPNSCNTCHADKTPEWALDFVKKWWPKSEK